MVRSWIFIIQQLHCMFIITAYCKLISNNCIHSRLLARILEVGVQTFCGPKEGLGACIRPLEALCPLEAQRGDLDSPTYSSV